MDFGSTILYYFRLEETPRSMNHSHSSAILHSQKIFRVISRLDLNRSQNRTWLSSNISFNSGNNHKSRSRTQKEQLQPLGVDVLKHKDHNILVFFPSTIEDKEQKTKKHIQLGKQSIRTRQQKRVTSSGCSGFSQFSQIRNKKEPCDSLPSSRSTWRVKRVNTLREETDRFKDLPSEETPLTKYNIEIKSPRQEAPLSNIKKQPSKRKALLPSLCSFVTDHSLLGQLQKKYKSIEKRVVSESQKSPTTAVKDLFSQKGSCLFSSSLQAQVQSADKVIGFFLNSIYSHNPTTIKRLFVEDQEGVRLAINYEGCFRTFTVESLRPEIQAQLVSGESGVVWPRLLNQVLGSLYKNYRHLEIGQMYEALTGLVLKHVNPSSSSNQYLLQQITSTRNKQTLIIGETNKEQLSLIQHTDRAIRVKKFVIENVFSEVTCSPEQLASNLSASYKHIYILDLYPNYFFTYKKIKHNLGIDSSFRINIPHRLNLILQVSKQTIPFESVFLTLEQQQQQLDVLYRHQLKSGVGFQDEVELLPGVYSVRVSDARESIHEYSFNLIVGLICRENISSFVEENSQGGEDDGGSE